MAHQHNLVPPHLLHKLGEVVDEVRHQIGALGRPGAVAMAPKIRRHDMEVTRECSRGPIPAARMIQGAMHQDQCGSGAVSPIDIMQASTQ